MIVDGLTAARGNGQMKVNIRQAAATVGAVCCLVISPAWAGPLSKQQFTAIDAAAAKALAATGVPAASIAIVQDGKIVYARAYGMERPGVPARTASRYAIASVSKQFTAAAILMLADEGKLSLDDKVGRFLPDLTRSNEVTIRQLLTHTAGYRDWWPQDYVFDDMTRPTTPAAILDRWAKAPLDFEPGTRFQYSNTGYVAAGMIVERASGQPLMTYLRDRVFARLGMTPTDADTGLPPNSPTGYSRAGLGPVRPAKAIAAGWSFGSAELVMTASDLARWDISVIDKSLMSSRAYAAEQHEEVLKNGLGTGYGLGVDIDEVKGHRRIKHDGGFSGFFSENRIYPDDRAALVVLNNADFGDADMVIADVIEDQLFSASDGTARVRDLFNSVRVGTIDRAKLTDNGKAYFTPAVLADYRAGLGALGAPTSIIQISSGLRGGLTVQRFILDFASRKLRVTIRSEPGADGRIEEFELFPIE